MAGYAIVVGIPTVGSGWNYPVLIDEEDILLFSFVSAFFLGLLDFNSIRIGWLLFLG